MNRVVGKNIVITGASSGIGAQMAFEVARLGGYPILLARRENKLQDIAKRIKEMYQITCKIFCVDVRNEQEIQQTFDSIYKMFGQVDVLINNAGFGIFKSVVDATMTEVQD